MKNHFLLPVLVICLSVFSFQTMASTTTYDSAMNAYDRRDYHDAIKQFSELAEQGDPYAQFMLGKMYAIGEGVTKDYLQAYKWLHLAGTGGVDAAVPLKKRIGKRMSRRKINKARQLATAWQETRMASTTQPDTVGSEEIDDLRVVKQVQQKLKEYGYYFDKIDGIPGPGTRNAIKVYQHSKGVREDDRITLSLLDLMDIPPVPAEIPPAHLQNDDIASFKRELRAIIAKAKRRNSADPWLISRLEQLAEGEIDPWPNVVFDEKFQEQGYWGGEEWRVINGNFRVESGVGLVGSASTGWGSTDRIDDLAISILEILINQKNLTTLTRDVAKIESAQSFSDSFALTVKTGLLQSTKGLFLSCTAEEDFPLGYQFAFHPGQRERAKLFRISGNNATEIPSYVHPIDLTTNTDHTFAWTRIGDGTMTVTVDGQQLLTAKETDGYPQGFDTLALTHIGNRIIFQEIHLRDTSEN